MSMQLFHKFLTNRFHISAKRMEPAENDIIRALVFPKMPEIITLAMVRILFDKCGDYAYGGMVLGTFAQKVLYVAHNIPVISIAPDAGITFRSKCVNAEIHNIHTAIQQFVHSVIIQKQAIRGQ